MRFFSIVIPTACRSEREFSFLDRLLESIGRQTFSDYEVVISDDVPSEGISRRCSEFSQSNQLRYFIHPYGPGNSAANANFGISRARGKFIKVMHQDDFFYSENALQSIHDALESAPGYMWGVAGFNHLADSEPDQFFEEIIPSITQTLGGPSASFFYSGGNPFVFFDESLVELLDHDMHQRLLWKFGPPLIIPETLVSIGLHDAQLSHTVPTLRAKLERQYFLGRQRLFLHRFPEAEPALERISRLNGSETEPRMRYVSEVDASLAVSGRGLHPLAAAAPRWRRQFMKLWRPRAQG